MLSAFLDANILFAAALSPTGASHELVRLAALDTYRPVASALVLEEARRNLQRKAPDVVPAWDRLVEVVGFEIVFPDRKAVEQAAGYTVLKDAPVVAAAQLARVDYLVSLDRKHLVENVDVVRESGLRIVLPQDFLAVVRTT